MNTPVRMSGTEGTAPTITIIGAGAIGTLLAAILEKGGHRPTLIDRSRARAEERSRHGIMIKSANSCRLVKIPVAATPAECAKAEIVFICVKAYDTAAAAAILPQITTETSIIVSLQNGIGNAEIIDQYAPGRTLCAITSMGADIENNRTTRQTGDGLTALAPFGSTPIRHAETVAAILKTCDCTISVRTDTESMLWSKLIINAAINPVTAIHRITNGELLHHPALHTAKAIAQECAAVAQAANIKLPYSDPVEAFMDICRKTAANRSSMLRDIINGRKTEINAINGAIIKLADSLNLPAPENSRVLSKITKLSPFPRTDRTSKA